MRRVKKSNTTGMILGFMGTDNGSRSRTSRAQLGFASLLVCAVLGTVLLQREPGLTPEPSLLNPNLRLMDDDVWLEDERMRLVRTKDRHGHDSFGAGVDAILVPGGGLKEDGQPATWVMARLEVATKLYNEAAKPKPKIITLSGGTPHKPPPLATSGQPISEAAAGARVLVKQWGINPADVLEEAFSLDTIGNAYWVRTLHTDPARFRRVVVVTNAFHMPRVKAIFGWVFSLTGGGWTESDGQRELGFATVPNVGLSDAVLQVRRAKEAASLESLPKTSSRVRTLSNLHSFVFNEHMAYASKRHLTELDPPMAIDPLLKATY